MALGLKCASTKGAQTFVEYIRYLVMPRDPKFLTLGSEFINRHTRLCEEYANHSFERMGAWPPSEWLGEQVSVEDTSQSYALTNCCVGAPDDEIRAYCKSSHFLEKYDGNAGVVLIRDGRIISDVVTMVTDCQVPYCLSRSK